MGESRKEARGAPATKKARKARVPAPARYDDVWADVYLAGTEWEQLRGVHDHAWDFEHLDEALMPGGALCGGPLVHLFGCTEPQLVPAHEGDADGTLVVVPVIVAVVSSRAPPAVVGIKSVQRATEEIVDMEKIRMGWHPRPADNAPRRNPPRPMVHVLKCSERRARLKNMDEAAVHKYDYVLPYIFRPGKNEAEVVETTVQVMVDDLEGRQSPLVMDFDYELDAVGDFVEETMTDNDLYGKDVAKKLTDAIKAEVRAYKLSLKKDRDALQARIDALSPEEKHSLDTMQVYKFYPSNEEEKFPDVSKVKVSYVNRYYGRADHVC